MKLDREIFHKFFYAGETENAKGRASVSFYGRTFKSYSTTIGIKTPGKDGRPVLLIADSSFSNTTSAHLSALRAACPYTSSHIIRVPFEWGECWYDDNKGIQDLLRRFINQLSDYEWKIDQLKYAKNRRDFLSTYYNFSRFLELVAPKRPNKEIIRKIEELATIARETEDRKKRNELISGLTAKREAAAKRKAAAEKRKHAELLKQFKDVSYLDNIRIAYWEYFRPEVSHETRATLRGMFNPDNSLSYVVPELSGEDVITTQDVRMDGRTVRALLKAWKAGKVKVGQHVGPYTIQEIKPGYVKIGCHKIPMQNIRELYSVLIEDAAE
jgi:hypothetical protein|nr:MAG TPA: hypothetical protein [Bacteriophage sp.]